MAFTPVQRTPEEWWQYYQTLPLQELKIHAGQSMGLETSGGKAAILARIRTRMEDRLA